VIGTLADDGWAVTFGTARKELSGLRLLAVPNVTAHPSSASNKQRVLYQSGNVCILIGIC